MAASATYGSLDPGVPAVRVRQGGFAAARNTFFLLPLLNGRTKAAAAAATPDGRALGAVPCTSRVCACACACVCARVCELSGCMQAFSLGRGNGAGRAGKEEGHGGGGGRGGRVTPRHSSKTTLARATRKPACLGPVPAHRTVRALRRRGEAAAGACHRERQAAAAAVVRLRASHRMRRRLTSITPRHGRTASGGRRSRPSEGSACACVLSVRARTKGQAGIPSPFVVVLSVGARCSCRLSRRKGGEGRSVSWGEVNGKNGTTPTTTRARGGGWGRCTQRERRRMEPDCLW